MTHNIAPAQTPYIGAATAPPHSITALPHRVLQGMPWAVLALSRKGIVTLANPQAARLLGRLAEELVGSSFTEKKPPNLTIELQYALQEAIGATTPVTGEFFLPNSQQWIEMSTEPGEAEVLVYCQDVTRVKAQQLRYLSLANSIPDVITRWDSSLRLRYANSAIEAKTGQKVANMLGKTLPEMELPDFITGPYQAKLRHAFDTGQSQHYYNMFPTPQGERHFHSRFIAELLNGKVHRVQVISHDITELKQAEQELKQAHERLNAIFKSVPLQLGYYRSVRDEQGNLVDLRSETINEASVSRLNLPPEAQGLLMSEQLPGMKEHTIWQTITKVIETGQAERMELEYDFGPHAVWFDVAYARLEDGIISASNDITARKHTEQALRDSQQLLEAIYNATLDSLEVLKSVRDEAGHLIDFEWVLNNEAAHRLMQRTDLVGKRLLTEEPGMKPSGVFDRMCQVVEQQQPADFEQYYPYDGDEEWFHIAAAPLGDGLVVNWQDITERKRATAEMLRLQLVQHQQIANAVLDAQESERKRIGESLHNGLGQLLYAAKLRVEQLEAPTTATPSSVESKRKAEQMLSAAISQTRHLSHQLMPIVLTDFGLEAAIRDICHDFSSPRLRMHCVAGALPPLNQSLALAIYRMAQELINNIVKHADATEAHLQLTESDGWLQLRAEDNGRGFDLAQTRKNGMGLSVLQDRAKLLNGHLTITSSPEQGTLVTIRVPCTALTTEPPRA